MKMLVGLTGAISLQPGDEYEFPQAEALRLASAGFAVPVSGEAIERAVKAPARETRKKGRPDALA